MNKCYHCGKNYKEAVRCNERQGDHVHTSFSHGCEGECKCGIILNWKPVGIGDKEYYEKWANIRCSNRVCPYCGRSIG